VLEPLLHRRSHTVVDVSCQVRLSNCLSNLIFSSYSRLGRVPLGESLLITAAVALPVTQAAALKHRRITSNAANVFESILQMF